MKRRLVQLLFALLANAYPGPLGPGGLYRGPLKGICFPGLNCYSCPLAPFACPLGSLQQSLASLRALPLVALKGLIYVLGFFLLCGLLLGRLVCGWLCPFGLLQELLYKIPFFKSSLPRVLFRTKYLVLLLLVILLPLLLVDTLGYGKVWFCRLLCPAGTLEAGVFNLALRPELRALVRGLFFLKLGLLGLILFLCLVYFRFFCAVLCPLGAIYGLFNRLGFLKLLWQDDGCLRCGVCEKVCPMGLSIPQELNSPECIRCLHCLSACPNRVIRLCFGEIDSFRVSAKSSRHAEGRTTPR